MHRAACLPEIDCFESGRCPPHGPKMPLGFLNKVEERVSVPISRGQGRGERALERGKRCAQVTSMVDRPVRRAQAVQAFGRFANAFASSLDGFVVDDRASDRRSCASAGSLRVGSGPDAGNHAVARRRTYSARAGRPNSSAPPFWFGGDLRVVCAARPLGGGTLGPVAAGRPASRTLATTSFVRHSNPIDNSYSDFGRLVHFTSPTAVAKCGDRPKT